MSASKFISTWTCQVPKILAQIPFVFGIKAFILGTLEVQVHRYLHLYLPGQVLLCAPSWPCARSRMAAGRPATKPLPRRPRQMEIKTWASRGHCLFFLRTSFHMPSSLPFGLLHFFEAGFLRAIVWYTRFWSTMKHCDVQIEHHGVSLVRLW